MAVRIAVEQFTNWFVGRNVVLAHRAGDHADCETFAVGPEGDGRDETVDVLDRRFDLRAVGHGEEVENVVAGDDGEERAVR